MVSVLCTILLDHVIKMRASCYDTDFASEKKLTKLALIHCFEGSTVVPHPPPPPGPVTVLVSDYNPIIFRGSEKSHWFMLDFDYINFKEHQDSLLISEAFNIQYTRW